MKNRCWTAIGVCAIAAVGALMVGSTSAGQNNYGPLLCRSCPLGNPLIDANTSVFVTEYIKAMSKTNVVGHVQYEFNKGDVITICNGTKCVDYIKSTSGNWGGNSPRPQDPPLSPPPAGGGGGGGGGGGWPGSGGSGPIGGGGGGRGNGTVTVGPIQQE